MNVRLPVPAAALPTALALAAIVLMTAAMQPPSAVTAPAPGVDPGCEGTGCSRWIGEITRTLLVTEATGLTWKVVAHTTDLEFTPQPGWVFSGTGPDGRWQSVAGKTSWEFSGQLGRDDQGRPCGIGKDVDPAAGDPQPPIEIPVGGSGFVTILGTEDPYTYAIAGQEYHELTIHGGCPDGTFGTFVRSFTRWMAVQSFLPLENEDLLEDEYTETFGVVFGVPDGAGPAAADQISGEISSASEGVSNTYEWRLERVDKDIVVNVDGDEPNADPSGLCDVDLATAESQCTLRAAIETANSRTGKDTIKFDPSVTEVEVASALPEITGPAILDGSLPGGGKVELVGTGEAGVSSVNLPAGGFPADGLALTAGDSTIKNFFIHGFAGSGINISGGGSNRIESNVIGVGTDYTCPDFDNTTKLCRGNGEHGIYINTSDANIIGGSRPGTECSGPCNVISGNLQNGVYIVGGGSGKNIEDVFGDSNQVLGNVIGLGKDGGCADYDSDIGCKVGNGHNGVLIDTARRTIVGGSGHTVGSCDGVCNLVGGNVMSGVVIYGGRIHDGGAMLNRIEGNFAGTDAVGDCDTDGRGNCRHGNRANGVVVAGGHCPSDVCGPGQGPYDGNDEDRNFIGGTVATQGNVLSGNRAAGLLIAGDEANQVAAWGNRIGTNAAGAAASPNGVGVKLTGDAQDFGLVGVTGSPVVILVGGSDLVEPPKDAICSAGCNLISGNRAQGILAINVDAGPSGAFGHAGDRSFGNNFIGTNLAGTGALPNGTNGVEVVNTEYADVYGSLVSGNSGAGVIIREDSHWVVVESNFIGTDVTGADDLGNSQSGVTVSDSNMVGIGTAQPSDPQKACFLSCNLISGNGGAGVFITGATTHDVFVQSSVLGADFAGTAPIPNGNSNIYVYAGAHAVGIGEIGSGNLVAASPAAGITVEGASGVRIAGNMIGTTFAGTCPLQNDICPMGNKNVGVFVKNSNDVVIGGVQNGERNIISGNAPSQKLPGVAIVGSSAQFNRVEGNIIGLDKNGADAIPNGGGGVWAFGGAHDNTIGGNVPNAANVIGNNAPFCKCPAILLLDADNNKVQGNFIGVRGDGTTPAANKGHGIAISDGSSGNLVGGTAAAEGNVIAHNGDGKGFDGVRVYSTAGDGNRITHNKIFGNTGLGIDIAFDGVTANDALDGDGGGNQSQNYPVLTSATQGTVQGTLKSTPNSTFTIDLYSNTACHTAFGFGQGETMYESVEVITDGSGIANFSRNLPPSGTVITATATNDDGGTSEFSRCIEIGDTFIATDTDGDGVEDGIEGAGPDNGDGNDDGTPDSQQANVATIPNSIDGQFLVLESPDGTQLQGVVAVDSPAPDSTPPGIDFPFGFVSFRLTGIAQGGTATVTLQLPENMTPSGYWKYGPEPEDEEPHWFEFDANIAGSVVTLQVTDGESGDLDLEANSSITDPFAPATGHVSLTLLQGDVDCDSHVTGPDALALLLHMTGESYARSGGCPRIGSGAPAFGDTDCSDEVDSADVLQVLRFSGGLPAVQHIGCTPVGQAIVR